MRDGDRRDRPSREGERRGGPRQAGRDSRREGDRRGGASSYRGSPGDRGGTNARRGGRPGGADRRSDRPANRNPRGKSDAPGPEKSRIDAPPLPEGIDFRDLPKDTRARLRTLSKANAEDVGAHLLMAGALLHEEPELAYKHAKVAAARGGRVDVVREAMALTAYATGRYDEALREFRTVRRLNGDNEHMPAMADCERGLGRPERALDLAREPEASSLSREAAAELQIVVAGARMDLGEHAAAISTLKAIDAPTDEARDRIDEALADALRAAGREDDAAAVDAARAERQQALPHDASQDVVWVFETVEEEAEAEPDARESAPAAPEPAPDARASEPDAPESSPDAPEPARAPESPESQDSNGEPA